MNDEKTEIVIDYGKSFSCECKNVQNMYWTRSLGTNKRNPTVFRPSFPRRPCGIEIVSRI